MIHFNHFGYFKNRFWDKIRIDHKIFLLVKTNQVVKCGYVLHIGINGIDDTMGLMGHIGTNGIDDTMGLMGHIGINEADFLPRCVSYLSLVSAFSNAAWSWMRSINAWKSSLHWSNIMITS